MQVKTVLSVFALLSATAIAAPVVAPREDAGEVSGDWLGGNPPRNIYFKRDDKVKRDEQGEVAGDWLQGPPRNIYFKRDGEGEVAGDWLQGPPRNIYFKRN